MRGSGAASSTPERLLDAAECLVALHGFDVPLRRIIREAGQRNNAAVDYHFGSREALMDAVWDRRSDRVKDRRARMIDQLHEQGSTEDLLALMEAYVLPLVEEIGSQHRSYWARFNEVALARMPMMFLGTFDANLSSYTERPVSLRTLSYLFHLMRKCVGDGSEPTAGLHVALTARFVIGSLAAWERDYERGAVAAASLQPLGDALVSMGAHMLARPVAGLGDAMGLLDG